jgi:hypothetical protein
MSKSSTSFRFLVGARAIAGLLCAIAIVLVLPRHSSARQSSGSARISSTPSLATDLVRFRRRVSQEECLARAEKALRGAGFGDLRSDPTAVGGRMPRFNVQIECLSGRGFNLAYITTAYTSNAAEFRAKHDPLLRAMEM